MPRRILALLCALLLCAMALAEAPYCVVGSGIALLVDEDGEILAGEGDWDDFFTIRPGSLYAAGKGGEYRMMDASGEVLSEESFHMIRDCGDALVFRRGFRYGAMDASGAVTVEPRWTQLASDGRGGWLALSEDVTDEIPDELIHVDAGGVRRGTGILVLGTLGEVSEDRMAFAGPSGLWGYVNGAGEEVLPAQYRYAGDFHRGRAIITTEGGSGVIDRDGAFLIAPEYPFLLALGEGFAALDGGGALTLFVGEALDPAAIPTEGTVEISPAGEWLTVVDGQSSRLMDADGIVRMTLPPGARFAPGTGGQAIVTDLAVGSESSWLADADGTPVPGRYRRLLPLCEGRYAVLAAPEEGGKAVLYGLMDERGRELLPAEYRGMRALDDQRLLLFTEDQVIFADREGVPLRSWLRADATAAIGEPAP